METQRKSPQVLIPQQVQRKSPQVLILQEHLNGSSRLSVLIDDAKRGFNYWARRRTY